MALDPAALHRALATQINTYVGRDINVAAFPYSGKPLPLIEVWPGNQNGEYLGYSESFGAEGVVDMRLRLKIQVATADAETAFIQMTDFLAVGTSRTSSVPDAVMNDKTIGGRVHSAVVLTAQWDPADDDLGSVAWIPVDIRLSKTGAKV